MRGLDDHAIAGLLQASGHTPDERDALVGCCRADAGNPFFLCELVAHMVEMGTIVGSAGADQLAVPERLRQLICNRVARLSSAAGQALNVAAVAGTEFSFALLEHVLGEDPALLPALEEAVARRLVTETEDGNYAFVHALVRETIYEALGSVRRIRLHRRVGEALESFASRRRTPRRSRIISRRRQPMVRAPSRRLRAGGGQGAVARLGYEEGAATTNAG